MTTEDLPGQRAAEPTTPLLAPQYRGATVGAVALVFLAAFEALAVATVMPTVTADLDGRELFAVAFSATLAASVVGMVAAGSWADRDGAVRPLLASVAMFGFGLLASGLAPTMTWLVVGRFAQGLGFGGLIVSLYVLVAQVYEQVDRPRILGLFAAAWVLPGLVGPFLAGIVADTVGWRWVFLGVVVIAAAALSLLVPTLRHVPPPGPDDPAAVMAAGPGGRGRLGLAVAVSGAVVALNLAGNLAGAYAAVVAVVAVTGALVAVHPLLPRGTLRAARGLPSVIGLRGLVAGAFFASESYLPYLLQEQYDAATWVSGLVLTVATLSWATASQVQGRLGERLPDEAALRIGSVLLAVGVAQILAIAALGLPGLLVGVGWLFASAGMGLMFPRITSAVLKRTAVQERGTATSAITISDSVGSAVAVAVVGLVFTAVGTAADREAFVSVLVVTTGMALVAVGFARRA